MKSSCTFLIHQNSVKELGASLGTILDELQAWAEGVRKYNEIQQE